MKLLDESERQSIKGLRVLVVEDMLVVAEEIASMLRRLDCQVVGPVPRLRSAFAVVEREKFDGAVLDVNLNGESVYPLAKALDERSIPFILATGYDRGGLPAEFQSSPRLEKPFSESELAAAMLGHFSHAH